MQKPTHIIRPTQRWYGLGFNELLLYRELLLFFAWRDVKVRYQQTALGVMWVIIQPLLYGLAFSLIFGRLLGPQSNNIPYPLFCFAGLVIWNLFSTGVSLASASVVSHGELIQKVYFPRLILPLSAVAIALVDFSINLGALFLLMAYYGVVPTIHLIFAPILIIVAAGTALGFGASLAALNVQYRDIRHITPFLMQIWLLATPVAYPARLISSDWSILLALNPMSGIVEGFRWAVLGTHAPNLHDAASSFAISGLALFGGILLFRRLQYRFADII
ncbi:ABC transporter permease [Sphingobium phenoxybenzoativorans]|uniref:Transport permease protein n=1 Tax=Sphingobium phenoxybenzoativorans TaxID=1592790 RepID=A0A975Q1C8_9SPHN|nr:ABC transporter permease [Sphingobium phenoxybenzoativorans]QUT05679.1 ABC transporter permease [Sphingobium phenoxybenzoativorans]